MFVVFFVNEKFGIFPSYLENYYDNSPIIIIIMRAHRMGKQNMCMVVEI